MLLLAAAAEAAVLLMFQGLGSTLNPHTGNAAIAVPALFLAVVLTPALFLIDLLPPAWPTWLLVLVLAVLNLPYLAFVLRAPGSYRAWQRRRRAAEVAGGRGRDSRAV